MKNTTANTAAVSTIEAMVAVATTTNKGGIEMATKFNTVLTAAVVNTANKMGAYVPAGLKVEVVNGEVKSNGTALIMNAMFAGKITKKQAMIYTMDLDTAIMSAHVEETVEEVVAQEAADAHIEAMVVAPTCEEEVIAEEIAVKTIVKMTAFSLQVFKAAKARKAARFAESKARVSASKTRRKAIKALFKNAAAAVKEEKAANKLMASLRIKGMNKTGFLGQARKRALSKHLRVTINTLKINKLGKFEIGVTVMEENEAIRLGYIKGEGMNARAGKNSLHFDNFSKQLVLIDLSADKSSATGLTKFYIWWNGRNTVFAKLIDGVYYDLVSGVELKARAKAPREFEVIGGSPSSLRKDQTLAFDVTNGYGDMDAMLDAVTDGGYSRNKGKKTSLADMSKYVTRFFAWSAPNKVIGQINNAAIYFGKWNKDKLDGMAFVSSEFYAAALTSLLKAKLYAHDVQGLSVQCRPYSAKVNAVVANMKAIFGLLSNEADEVVYIEKVTPAIERALNETFAAKGKKGEYKNKMVVFGKKGCEIEFVSDLNGYKTEFNWGAPSNFRVLDITKLEGSSKIRNGANTSIQMWETPLSNDAALTMDYLQTLRNEQVTEIFNDLYCIDPMAQGTETDYNDFVKVPSLVDLDKNVHVQGIAKQIAPDYALNKDFAMYKKLHEELFVRINKLDSKFKYAIDGCYNRILSDVACLAVEHGVLQYGEAFIANGEEYFTSPENADRFMGESAAVRECYGKRIVSMFKYPKMGTKEFYRATLITLDRIISRVARLIDTDRITEEQGAAIVDFYASLKSGSIVVPSVDLLKQQCAGLDFDWDGASIIFDPRFNALLPSGISITNIVKEDEKEEEEVVQEDKPKVKHSLVNLVKNTDINGGNAGIAICAETLKEAFLAYMTSDNGGWSVGSITNTNTTQIAVLILAKVTRKKKYFMLMKDMLIKWFGHEGGEGEYVGLPRRTVDLASMDDMFPFEELQEGETICAGMEATVINVSPSAVAEAIASMENADWNKPMNLIRIFEDLNEIFRYYQELTIDSAKTGERVTVSVAPGKHYHACMLNTNKLAWNWGRGIEESAEKEATNKGEVLTIAVNDQASTEKKTPIHDILFDLRKEFVADMQLTSSAIIENKDVKMALADVVNLAKYFNNTKYLGEAGQAHKSLAGGMFKIKAIYGDLTANYIDALALAGEDEEAIGIAQLKYREGLQALRAMGRDLTSHLSMTQRGAFAKFIASHRAVITKVAGQEKLTVSLDKTGGSTFASSVFAEEYLLYIVKHFAHVDFCGEKLAYNEFYQDGDVITLDGGMSEFAATTADITGEFVVREFNGQFYATRQIADVVCEKPGSDAVLVRISDADEATMGKVATALNKAGKVTLFAQSVKQQDGKFEHTYGVFENGVQLAGIDAQGSFAKLVNGRQGKIKDLICGVTEYGNTRKPYILALVVPTK